MSPTAARLQTRDRIVETAAELLRTEGPAAVTTRRVATEAGVQAPTLYRLFGDKDGLLEAVAEHVMAAYVADKAAVVAAASAHDVDPLDDLRTGWLAQIDFALANPAVYGMFSTPGRLLSSPAAQAGQQVLDRRMHRLAATGRLRVSEDRAAAMIQAAGVGAIQLLLATPPQDRDPELAPALLEATLAAILIDGSAAVGAGVRPHAVALRAVAPELAVLSPGERRLLTEWLDRVVDAD